MEEKLSRVFRVAIAILVVLALGIIGGFVTTASAQNVQEENVLLLETEKKCSYAFYKDGYRVDTEELIPFEGTYILTGEASRDISFKRAEGEETTTYNLILHNWKGDAEVWYGLISVDNGVTLNITAYGINTILASNHPGIKTSDSHNNVCVNITVKENSSLEIGGTHSTQKTCISEGVTLSINQEAQSSVDMSDAGWKNNQRIKFTRGEAKEHKFAYEYVDGDVCKKYCVTCSVITPFDVNHDFIKTELDESDENVNKEHALVCRLCNTLVRTEEHSLVYVYNNESQHKFKCNTCYYVIREEEHTVENNECTACKEPLRIHYSVNGQEKTYFNLTPLLEIVNEYGGTVKLLNNLNSSLAIAPRKDLTIDLAGFTLENVSFKILDEVKITIKDSSQDKSGKLTLGSNGYANISKGHLLLDGIEIGIFYAQARGDGFIEIKNSKGTEKETYISLYLIEESGKIELSDVTFAQHVSIYANASIDNGQIKIHSGSFNILESGGNSYAVLSGFLVENKAYSSNGEILNANCKRLEKITEIIDHTHIYDAYLDLGSTHTNQCVCGLTNGNSQPHTLGEVGLCQCGLPVCAFVTSDGEDGYYVSAQKALDRIGERGGELKLLRDCEFENGFLMFDSVIDLNGYTLKSVYDRIEFFARLEINDTSAEKSGVLLGKGNGSYILQFESGAELVINSGEICGYIFNKNSNEESTVTVNGGKFTGDEAFRTWGKVKVVINDGWFYTKSGAFNIYNQYSYNITINKAFFVNSTVIKRNDGAQLSSIDSILGSVDGCTLTFLNDFGREVELSQLCEEYKGMYIVTHKDAGIIGEKDNHYFYCNTCQEKTAILEHGPISYETVEGDATKHLIRCMACGLCIGTREHSGGRANCNKRAECQDCGMEYGELDLTTHLGGSATCLEKAVCMRCKKPYGELDESNHASRTTSFVQNGDKHEKVADCCKAVIEQKDHVYESICDEDCNECAYTRTAPHSYNGEEICTQCGNKAEKNGLGTGAIIGIVIGSVASLGGGGFLLFWFLIRKKRI